MQIGILVFVAIIVAAFVIAVASQVIGPSQLRRQFVEEMGRRGWAAVDTGADPAWAVFADLAANGSTGPDARFDYEAQRGIATETGAIRKRQRAATAAAFREPAGGHARFAAAGSRVLVEDHAYQVAGLSARPLSWSKAHELWIGEARPLAVDRPATVFSALHEIARGLPQAAKDPAVVGLPPLLEGDLAESVRAVLRRSEAMSRFAPTVHVGPSAWVLTSMTEKAAPHVAELLDLAAEIARALDGAASPARGRSA